AAILLPQFINGVLLPIELIFILLLINDRAVMGRYTNSRPFNAIAWTTAIVLIALAAFLLGSAIVGALFA
ncbi:MAG: divalent metal cation transporter, partial [Chloroflexota bacterium]|nr:divalent metal cation transporter [Chloroflexota bacterium]